MNFFSDDPLSRPQTAPPCSSYTENWLDTPPSFLTAETCSSLTEENFAAPITCSPLRAKICSLPRPVTSSPVRAETFKPSDKTPSQSSAFQNYVEVSVEIPSSEIGASSCGSDQPRYSSCGLNHPRSNSCSCNLTSLRLSRGGTFETGGSQQTVSVPATRSAFRYPYQLAVTQSTGQVLVKFLTVTFNVNCHCQSDF